MKKYLLFLICGIVIGGLIYHLIFPCEEVKIPEIIRNLDKNVLDSLNAEIDDLRLRVKNQKIENVKAEIETLYVDNSSNEKFSRELLVSAKGDTVFEDGYLQAEYFFPPVNKFNFNWDPKPPKVIIKFKPEKRKLRFYEKRWFNFGAGVLSTAIVVYLVK